MSFNGSFVNFVSTRNELQAANFNNECVWRVRGGRGGWGGGEGEDVGEGGESG